MIQFLYEAGHDARAQALSSITPNSRCGHIDTTKPAALPGLDTITFWGHGDAFKLCGKNAREIHEVVKAWKALNAGLTTIEVITCNARHSTGGDPFVNQLKNGIGMFSSLRGMKIKALPTSVMGKSNAWSILLAETIHKSWCYITAPGANDQQLMQVTSQVSFDQGPNGAVSYRGDIAIKADRLVREAPMTRQWTMNYGYFNTLRACLGTV